MYSEAYLLAKEARSYLEALRDATDSKERQLFKARADEYFARALQLKRGLQAQFNPPPPIGGSPASSPRGPALNRGVVRPQSAPVGHSTAPRTSRVAADVLVRDIPKFVGESKQATSDAWGLTAVKEEPPSIATHRVTEPEPELKLELELEPQAQDYAAARTIEGQEAQYTIQNHSPQPVCISSAPTTADETHVDEALERMHIYAMPSARAQSGSPHALREARAKIEQSEPAAASPIRARVAKSSRESRREAKRQKLNELVELCHNVEMTSFSRTSLSRVLSYSGGSVASACMWLEDWQRESSDDFVPTEAWAPRCAWIKDKRPPGKPADTSSATASTASDSESTDSTRSRTTARTETWEPRSPDVRQKTTEARRPSSARMASRERRGSSVRPSTERPGRSTAGARRDGTRDGTGAAARTGRYAHDDGTRRSPRDVMARHHGTKAQRAQKKPPQWGPLHGSERERGARLYERRGSFKLHQRECATAGARPGSPSKVHQSELVLSFSGTAALLSGTQKTFSRSHARAQRNPVTLHRGMGAANVDKGRVLRPRSAGAHDRPPVSDFGRYAYQGRGGGRVVSTVHAV